SCWACRACSMERRATSTGSPTPLPGSGAYTGVPARSPTTWSCWTALGRCRSAATSSGAWPSCFSQRASLPARVVLPAPCRPASMITVGGVLARRIRRVSPPRMLMSSSLTILTTCCAGFSACETSAPRARSLTCAMKSLTTGSATSASSSAIRISRAVALMSASESLPLLRSDEKTVVNRSESVSNTCLDRPWKAFGIAYQRIGSPTGPYPSRGAHSAPAGPAGAGGGSAERGEDLGPDGVEVVGGAEGAAVLVHDVEDVDGLGSQRIDAGGADPQAARAEHLPDPPQQAGAVVGADLDDGGGAGRVVHDHHAGRRGPRARAPADRPGAPFEPLGDVEAAGEHAAQVGLKPGRVGRRPELGDGGEVQDGGLAGALRGGRRRRGRHRAGALHGEAVQREDPGRAPEEAGAVGRGDGDAGPGDADGGAVVAHEGQQAGAEDGGGRRRPAGQRGGGAAGELGDEPGLPGAPGGGAGGGAVGDREGGEQVDDLAFAAGHRGDRGGDGLH